MKSALQMLASVARGGHWKLVLSVILAAGGSPSAGWAADPTDFVFITAEHSAYNGSGGLGVYSNSYTRALEEEYRVNGESATVTVIMPFYMRMYQRPGLVESLHDEGQEVRIGLDYGYSTEAGRHETFRAYSKWHGRVKMIFLRHMNRDGEPNYFDNKLVDKKGPLYAPEHLVWEAFGAFGKASAAFVYRYLTRTDVAVLNDWHVAHAAYFMRHPDFIGFGGRVSPKILGISHNFAHQGNADPRMMGVIGLDSRHFNPEGFELNGQINNMKMLFQYAHMRKTVSLTYAQETLTSRFGRGLEGLNQRLAREYRYTAILNAIDGEEWDPARIARDILPLLSPEAAADARKYVFDAGNLSGLKRGTRLVQDVFQLNRDPRAMIYLYTGRPDPQKGFEFLPGSIEYVLLHDPHVQVVFVGNPAPGVEETEWMKRFIALTRDERFRGRVVWKEFASDLELVALTWGTLNLAPSTFEPAGQTVQGGANVGAPSVGANVGGIAESIVTDPERRTGWKFEIAYHGDGSIDNFRTGENFIAALREANRVYQEDPAEWDRIVKNALLRQLIWREQIKDYRKLFSFMLDDGSEALLQSLGLAPFGKVYSVDELTAMLKAAKPDCNVILGGDPQARIN